MSPLAVRSPARTAALWAWLLHAAAALWIWWGWGPGVRGGLLFWMDFPLSLAWSGLAGLALLVAALVAGGAWWAALAAGLALLVGRAARRG